MAQGASRETASRRRIVVAGVGGTIASTGSTPADALEYKVTRAPDDLLDPSLGLDAIADVSTVSVAAVMSYRLDAPALLGVAKALAALVARDDVDGLVVTHGTDTLEETAYFLHLTLRTRKPVIVVGAMRPSSALSADGPRNLRDAVLLAVSEQAQGAGVLIAANGYALCARDARKSRTSAVDALHAGGQGVIGEISGDRVELLYASTKRHTFTSAFDARAIEALPRVDLIADALGGTGDCVAASVAGGARGLVISGLGNGSLSPPLREAAERAARDGLVVIRSSRVGAGIVSPLDSDAAAGLIPAGSLIPSKARILLITALASGAARGDIASIFRVY